MSAPDLDHVPLADLVRAVMSHVDGDVELIIKDGIDVYVAINGRRYEPADDLSNLSAMLNAAALLSERELPGRSR